jgi:hypothetical protein
VSVKGGRAIGTDDPQILKTVVVANPIDVIEDHRHLPATPRFTLATHLAARLFDPLLVKPPLQIAAGIGRPLDHNLGKRSLWPPDAIHDAGVRLEVLGRDLPSRGVLLQSCRIATGRAIAETAK